MSKDVELITRSVVITSELKMFDSKNKRTRKLEHLKLLDGFVADDPEDRLDRYLSPELAQIGLTGGVIRCKLDVDTSKLLIITEFDSPRVLTAEELSALLDYTKGQWSDGVGEGCFDQFSVSCFSVETLVADSDCTIEQVPQAAVYAADAKTKKELIASWNAAARANAPKGKAGQLLECLKAIHKGDRIQTKTISALIKRELDEKCKAKGNDFFYSDWTLLTLAVHDDHADIVQDLIESGADVNARCGSRDKAPIHYVRSVQTLNALIEAKTAVDALDSFKETALHQESALAVPTVVEQLLKMGLNVDARNQFNVTPLMVAAQFGYEATVELLLRNGADASARDISKSALSHSILGFLTRGIKGKIEITKLLLDAGAIPTAEELKFAELYPEKLELLKTYCK